MSTGTTIRPPWPDELARLALAFPDLNLNRACRPLVLVAAEPYERLVGAALVALPREGAAAQPHELFWEVRPRFASEAPALLERATAVLASGESLVCQERTPEGAAAASTPAKAGFACSQLHEVWRIPLAQCFERRRAFSALLRQRAAANRYAAHPATPGHRGGIISLVTKAGLLEPERVQFSDAHPAGYDRELSTVVVNGEEVVGVILVRRQGVSAFVETRVVAPAHIGRFNLPNALLLDRSLEVAEAAGLAEVALTVDPATAPETIRFAHKCGGARQSTLQLWRWSAP